MEEEGFKLKIGKDNYPKRIEQTKSRQNYMYIFLTLNFILMNARQLDGLEEVSRHTHNMASAQVVALPNIRIILPTRRKRPSKGCLGFATTHALCCYSCTQAAIYGKRALWIQP